MFFLSIMKLLLGIAAGIVALIYLAFIVLAICLDISDKKEFKRQEEDRKRMAEDPTYKPEHR